MNASDVAVATMTRIRGAGEERLLRDALSRLAGTGMPLFIADGGSGAAFRRFLAALPNARCCEPRGAGLAAQVQASIAAAAAAGRSCILYTEPDKAGFFEKGLEDFLARAPDDAGGLALASRTAPGFATFPEIQQFTESTLNRLCGDATGAVGDYCYGPFLFPPVLHRDLVALPPDLGWGWRPFLFAVAHRRGLRLRHVPGDYTCPPDQRRNTEGERLHRLRQLAENVNGLVLGITVDLEPAPRAE